VARVRAPALAVVGAIGTLLSFVLPWAHYGGIDIPLSRFPHWGLYVASALVLQLCVAWTVFAARARVRMPVPVVAAAGLLALGSAIDLMLRYDDPAALFDRSVPLVIPLPGEGGIVAVLAIVAGVGAALSARSGAGPRATDAAA